MTSDQDELRWTPDDVERRLQTVREVLLDFLRERTRLDWFRQKVRWRLSKQYIWPGAPEGLAGLLEEAVAKDGGVEAFMDYLKTRQRGISDAIERYNLALQRLMEQQQGVPVDQFDEASRAELRRRRITFQGTRDELLRRARGLTAESGPELIPELLTLRLAVLTEDGRASLFREVAKELAAEARGAEPNLSDEAQQRLAEATELRLRSLDQYHVAKLLAENYAEARRMMDVDELLGRYEALRRAEAEHPGGEPGRPERLELLREVLLKKIAYLEELVPASADTHEREGSLLRQPAVPGASGGTD